MITQDKPQNIEKSESHHFMISIYCISQNLNHQSTILLSHIFFKSPLSGFLDAPGHNAPPGETMKHWNYLRRQTAFRVRSFTEEFADSKTVKRLMLLQEDLKLNMFSIHIYIYQLWVLAASFVPSPSITRIEILYLIHYYSEIFLWYSEILRYWRYSYSQNHGKLTHERPLKMYGFSFQKKQVLCSSIFHFQDSWKKASKKLQNSCTLPETNIPKGSKRKGSSPNFQPSILRCKLAVSFREGNPYVLLQNLQSLLVNWKAMGHLSPKAPDVARGAVGWYILIIQNAGDPYHCWNWQEMAPWK